MLQGMCHICRGSLELKTNLSHLLLVYAFPPSPLRPLGAVALKWVPVIRMIGVGEEQASVTNHVNTHNNQHKTT